VTDQQVKTSFRETLSASHISAVAIAVLLLWSLDSGLQALWAPLPGAIDYLATSVAILGIPQISIASDPTLVFAMFELLNSPTCFAAAWLLSRWVYGVGPLHSLGKYRASLAWRRHV
jgi:hypothetical protein